MDSVSGDTLLFVKFRPLLRFPKFLLVRDSTRFLLCKNLRFDEPDFCSAKTGSLSRGRQKVTASFMDVVSGNTLLFVKFRPLLRFPKFLLVRDSTRFLLCKNLRFDEPDFCSAKTGSLSQSRQKVTASFMDAVTFWPALWDSNPPPSESESDTLSK